MIKSRWGNFRQTSPRCYLLVLFSLWKILLFSIALMSPGPGYDTSTELLEGVGDSNLLSLVRWDAIYFVEAARNGYVFEQQWAFSWTLTRAMAFLAKYLQLAGVPPATTPALAGVVIANTSHFLAVLVLYELSLRVFGRSRKGGGGLALVAAALHIVSPAGLFLSTPNAESAFALFHMLGMLLYADSFLYRCKGDTLKSDVWLLLAGASVGLAAALRSNGLVSGFYFAYDAVLAVSEIARGRASVMQTRKLAVIVLAGILVALGFALPQIVAYLEYCGPRSYRQRPWCSAMPPSIYAFVQDHYWHNGLFQYWTVSNLPLFVLAGPILTVMIVSSLWTFKHPSACQTADEDGIHQCKTRSSPKRPVANAAALRPIFAVPQALLAAFTLTAGHVQIANRLSSGYPVWYWWVANSFMSKSSRTKKSGWDADAPTRVASWMVMYALIQAVLYSSFLPPA